MITKTIAAIKCNADFRTDVCNLRIGHKYDVSPIEKCLKCKYSTIEYTTRGDHLVKRFLKYAASWKKQFGE